MRMLPWGTVNFSPDASSSSESPSHDCGSNLLLIMKRRSSLTASLAGDWSEAMIAMGELQSSNMQPLLCHPSIVHRILSRGPIVILVLTSSYTALGSARNWNALKALIRSSRRNISVLAPGSTDDWRNSTALMFRLDSSKVAFRFPRTPYIFSKPTRRILW